MHTMPQKRNSEEAMMTPDVIDKPEDMINRIVLGDCLETMKRMPDNFVDLILTDPPYGINIAKWDKLVGSEYMEEIFRVSKNQIIFGGNNYNLPLTESWIVWYKQPFLPNQAHAELAWTSFKQKMKVIHYRYAGNCEGYPDKLKVDYKKKSSHPTEKPVELMSNILKDYTTEGDTIYDPFIGSGTTAVAARSLNRNYIGSEISREYCDIAEDRLRQETLL